MKKFFLSLLFFLIFSSISPAVFADPPSTPEESLKAFEDFQSRFEERFSFLPVEKRTISMIWSSDCKIKVTRAPKSLSFEVEKGDKKVKFEVSTSGVNTFRAGDEDFRFDGYTLTCDCGRCSEPWYAYGSININRTYFNIDNEGQESMSCSFIE